MHQNNTPVPVKTNFKTRHAVESDDNFPDALEETCLTSRSDQDRDLDRDGLHDQEFCLVSVLVTTVRREPFLGYRLDLILANVDRDVIRGLKKKKDIPEWTTKPFISVKILFTFPVSLVALEFLINNDNQRYNNLVNTLSTSNRVSCTRITNRNAHPLSHVVARILSYKSVQKRGTLPWGEYCNR